MKRYHSISRRQFLQGTGAAIAAGIALPYFVPGRALGADGTPAASERIALIVTPSIRASKDGRRR